MLLYSIASHCIVYCIVSLLSGDCTANPCINGGTCDAATNQCVCTSDWSDLTCETGEGGCECV